MCIKKLEAGTWLILLSSLKSDFWDSSRQSVGTLQLAESTPSEFDGEKTFLLSSVGAHGSLHSHGIQATDGNEPVRQ